MPTTLPLVFHPNPILRAMSETVDPKDIPGLGDLWRDMAKTMKDNDGIGLAAPQIGQNIRLIIVSTSDGPLAMFNPELIKKSLLKEWGEEGCLSIPQTFGDVKRHKTIRCSFIDAEGNKRSIDAKGLLARVIQHEIDHINGILFIDKAKNIHTVK